MSRTGDDLFEATPTSIKSRSQPDGIENTSGYEGNSYRILHVVLLGAEKASITRSDVATTCDRIGKMYGEM